MTEPYRVVLEGEPRTGGVAGFVSWERLLEVLRAAGEIRTEERVVQLDAGQQGLRYYVEKRQG